MDEINKKLTAKVIELCGVDAASVTDDTDLIRDLAMKSATLVVLIAYLEDEFDVDIDFMKFRRATTIKQAVEFLDDLCNG